MLSRHRKMRRRARLDVEGSKILAYSRVCSVAAGEVCGAATALAVLGSLAVFCLRLFIREHRGVTTAKLGVAGPVQRH
jgi:hypothetical protein